MKQWLKRARGAIGIGLTWAAAWAPLGAIIGLVTVTVGGLLLGGLAVGAGLLGAGATILGAVITAASTLLGAGSAAGTLVIARASHSQPSLQGALMGIAGRPAQVPNYQGRPDGGGDGAGGDAGDLAEQSAPTDTGPPSRLRGHGCPEPGPACVGTIGHEFPPLLT